MEAQFGDDGAFSLSSISSLSVLVHYFHFPIGLWLLPVQPRLSFSVEGSRQLYSAHPLFACLHGALVKVFLNLKNDRRKNEEGRAGQGKKHRSMASSISRSFVFLFPVVFGLRLLLQLQ